MARSLVVLLGVSIVAVCLAVPRHEVPTAKVTVEKDIDVVENLQGDEHNHNDHHRRFRSGHHYQHELKHTRQHDDEVDQDLEHGYFNHHRHHGHRHHRHHRRHHRDCDSIEELILHITAQMARDSGLNRTDTRKLVALLKVQIDANKEDIQQDRSNWTEPQFREQYKRMEGRVHQEFQKQASQAIADKKHLAIFFNTLEVQSEKFKRAIFEIEKARLRRLAVAVNVSTTNFERFMSVVEANPIQVLMRRHMSIEERASVLDALNVEWMKIKDLSTRGMSDADKQKMEVFFDAVERDFIEGMQKQHEHHGHQHIRHMLGHRQYGLHHMVHSYRHGVDNGGEVSEYPHQHRSHRHHHRHHFHDDDEEAESDNEDLSDRHRQHRHEHRRHRHRSDDDVADPEERHYRNDGESQDENKGSRQHHHHHERHHRRQHRRHHDEDLENDNNNNNSEDDEENEVAPTRRSVHGRLRTIAHRRVRQHTSRDED